MLRKLYPNLKSGVLIPLLLSGALSTAHADDGSGKVMLVLDASGSMWGRVDEREKILIAREVVGEMLDDWDPALDLGLVAYGHRVKGDCSDIETLVPVGGGLQQIRDTVNGLQPKGKTPLSAAVGQAAEDLRFSEDKATVILVTDGKETCDLDPCEVGRQLEQLGVDFTAHVIGFDISEQDRSGLACLATETGGQYFDAQRSGDLKVALQAAVETIKQVPDTVVGTLGLDGKQIDQPIVWAVTRPDGSQLDEQTAVLALPVEPGAYQVVGSFAGIDVGTSIEVVREENREHVVVFNVGELEMQASVMESGKRLETDAVAWSVIAADDESEALEERGATASGMLPAGDYQVIATYEGVSQGVEITVTPGQRAVAEVVFEIQGATLEAAESVPMSRPINIEWTGPDGPRNYITIVAPDAADGQYGKYVYTKKGSPVELPAPDQPGVYELRYMDGDSKSALARRPVTVELVPTSIAAPESTAMGETLPIGWEGPDGKGDYITVVTPETPDQQYGKYVYTRDGTPLDLQMPDAPGIHEIRYVSGQSKVVLARHLIEIEVVAVTLAAQDQAPISKLLEVAWTGPGGKGDYLTVVTPDTDEGKYGKYVYTRNGSPVELLMPDAPGLYEIRYVSGQSKRVIGSIPVMLNDVAVSLAAPTTAGISAEIEVAWQGPDGKNDYLTVVATDTPDGEYGKYRYTRDGSPLSLQVPDTPGVYELRYVSGQSRTVMARAPIVVEAVAASLQSLSIASNQAPLKVFWEGPGAKNDYIAVSALTDPDNKHVQYTRASESPVTLKMPDQPGSYELRYVTEQSRQVLTRKLIEVVDGATYAESLGNAAPGKLVLSVSNADAAVTDGISWQVYGIDGINKTIEKSSDAVPTFDLPMGAYRVNVSTPAGSTSVYVLMDAGAIVTLELSVP